MSSEVALPTAADTTPSDKGTTIAFVGKDRRHNPPWWKYVQWSIAALFVGGSILFSIAELYDNMGINDPSLQTTVTHDYIINSIVDDRMVLELQVPMSLKQVFVRL